MEKLSLAHIGLVLGIIVILIGLWAILTRKNIIKIIVGFSLFDTGTHIVMVAFGYINGKTAPILDKAVNVQNAVKEIVDPVPQALVLTAIVIGLGITALMLAFALRLYQRRKTLELKKFNDLKW